MWKCSMLFFFVVVVERPLEHVWRADSLLMEKISCPIPEIEFIWGLYSVHCAGHSIFFYISYVFYIPVKGNLDTTAHTDILYNCVLPTWWQQFEEELHMGVMDRDPNNFSHIVSLKTCMHKLHICPANKHSLCVHHYHDCIIFKTYVCL